METLRAAPPKEKTKEKAVKAKKPASLAKPHPETDRPLSDEEIAAQAQANAHTYADPVPSGTSDAKPQVNEADKTVHVRDYTRKDGTHVSAYNRRPPSQ